MAPLVRAVNVAGRSLRNCLKRPNRSLVNDRFARRVLDPSFSDRLALEQRKVHHVDAAVATGVMLLAKRHAVDRLVIDEVHDVGRSTWVPVHPIHGITKQPMQVPNPCLKDWPIDVVGQRPLTQEVMAFDGTTLVWVPAADHAAISFTRQHLKPGPREQRSGFSWVVSRDEHVLGQRLFFFVSLFDVLQRASKK